MRVYIVILGLITSNLLFAQNVKEIELWADNYNNKVKYLNNGKYEQVIGSPYENESFADVEVEGIGKVVEKLRYNAVTDQLEFLKEEKVYNLTNMPDQLITLNNGIGPVYKFIKFNFQDGAKEGYTTVLVDGEKFKLLKRQIKYLKNTSKNSQVNQRDTSFEIDNKPAEYILESDGKYYKFPKNTKALASALGSKNSEEFKMLEKYNFNSQKDLIELVKLINQ